MKTTTAFEKTLLSEVRALRSDFLSLKIAMHKHDKEMTSKQVRAFLRISKTKLSQIKKEGLIELSTRKKLGKIKGDYYLTHSVVRYKEIYGK